MMGRPTTTAETASSESPVQRWPVWGAGALVVLAVVVLSASRLNSRELEGLDQAHHVMDGIFFRDLLVDHPVQELAQYPLDYYRHYPALGFKFWPPLFPLAEGGFFACWGLDVRVTRWCLLSFGILWALLVYRAAQRRMGVVPALLATLVMLTVPLSVEHLNTVMLEVPTLAMAMLTLGLYERVVRRGAWKSRWEVVGFAVVGAATVYTKQPMIFLFPALLIDLLVHHRSFFRRPETWAAGVLLVMLCIPLLLFTLKFGQENLAQSFGNQGNVYVPEHKVAMRWSWEGWSYYVRQLPRQCGWPLALLAAAALCACVCRRAFAQGYLIWAAWLVWWYLLFSLFDNKQPRFVLMAVPAVVLLASGMLHAVLARVRGGTALCAVGLGVVLLLQVHTILGMPPFPAYTGMDELVATTLGAEPGNLLYLGSYRQLLVPFVRIHDPQRRAFVLRGESLLDLKEADSLLTVAREYRVRWVFVESAAKEAQDHFGPHERQTLAEGPFALQQRACLQAGKNPLEVLVYRYHGPWAETMKEVPVNLGGASSAPAH